MVSSTGCQVVHNVEIQDLTLLPDIPSFRRLTRALAMLDAIMSPTWEFRYYSFNSRWWEGEMMASMRNGSGDHRFALLTAAVRAPRPRARGVELPAGLAMAGHLRWAATGIPREFLGRGGIRHSQQHVLYLASRDGRSLVLRARAATAWR